MLKGFCFCFLLPPSFHVKIFSKIPNYSSDPESVSRQQNATKQNKKDQVKEREQQAWKRQAITWNYSQREGRKKKEKKKKIHCNHGDHSRLQPETLTSAETSQHKEQNKHSLWCIHGNELPTWKTSWYCYTVAVAIETTYKRGNFKETCFQRNNV